MEINNNRQIDYINKKIPIASQEDVSGIKDSVELGLPRELPDKLPFTDRTGEHPVNLTFVHINDLHGYIEEIQKPDNEGIVGGIERLAGEVKELKSRDPEGTVIMDGGDLYDGGFYSKLSEGEVVSKPFKEMGVDVSVIGNHDVKWGLGKYASIAKGTGAEMLGANVTDLSPAHELDFLKPYKVLERKGVKIGVLGLTTPDTAITVPQKGVLKIEDPLKTAKTYIQKMKDDEHVDMVVILSHLGYDEDVKLAQQAEGIDVIVGSHTHKKMEEAEKVGNTIIVQAGGDGKYVGDLDLVFDRNQKKILSCKEHLIAITQEIKADPSVKQILAPYVEKFEKLKKEEIGETSRSLPLVDNKRTALINMFVDAQKMDSDIALSHMWSLRKGIDRGKITFATLYQMFPFDNELFKVEAKGKDVLKFLEDGLSVMKPEKDNTFIASGITYEYNPDLKDGCRITSVTMNGKKFTREDFENRPATVSLDDYWHGATHFKNCKVLKKYGKVFELLKKYIKENSPLNNLSDDGKVNRISNMASSFPGEIKL